MKPGEVVSLSNSALKVMQALPPTKPSAICVFEHIYFARPDQTWDGINVHHARQRLGEELAREVINGLSHGFTDKNGQLAKKYTGIVFESTFKSDVEALLKEQ